MKRLAEEDIRKIRSDVPPKEKILEFAEQFRAVSTELHMKIVVVLLKFGPQRPRDLIKLVPQFTLDIDRNLRKMHFAGILGRENKDADHRSSYYHLKSAEEIGSGGDMIHAILQELLEKIEVREQALKQQKRITS